MHVQCILVHVYVYYYSICVHIYTVYCTSVSDLCPLEGQSIDLCGGGGLLPREGGHESTDAAWLRHMNFNLPTETNDSQKIDEAAKL